MRTAQIDLIALIDADGDYAVGKTEEEAAEVYTDQVGELTASGGHRLVRVRLTVPLPAAVSLTGVVPAQGDAQMEVR